MPKFKLVIVAIICLAISFPIAGQIFGVGIVKDASEGEFQLLSNQIKSEIEALTKGRNNVVFYEQGADWQKEKSGEYLLEFMNNPEIDLIVTVGLLSSDVAAQLSDFPKPVITATILDADLQRLPLSSELTSGVHNFSYIESPIDIKKDLQSFSDLFNAGHVSVVLPGKLYDELDYIRALMETADDKMQISFVPLYLEISSDVTLPDGTDAVVMLPMTGHSTGDIQKLFSRFNSEGIPSLAIKGTDYLEFGTTVTYTPRFSFLQMARATATRIVDVIEGVNLSQIPVSANDETRRLVVNMESVRQIKKFPAWAGLKDAILMNVDKMPGEELGLHEAISLALEDNLQGHITDNDLLMARQDVKIARSNVLPSVDVSGSAVQLSENLVEASMGQRGEFTVTGSASLKQVLYSEEAFANIAIQKLVAENVEQSNRETMLDIVADVVEAYVNVLYGRNNLRIQNENLNANLQNLEIAESREQEGTASVSDVNRWKSEVNLARMDFNDAEAAYQSAMYRLNQLLNRAVAQPVPVPESIDLLKLVVEHQELLSQSFGDPLITERYADFLIEQMHRNSPELMKIRTAGDIAERKRKLYVRKSYLPEVALGAGADQAFVREGTIRNPQLPVPEPPDDITWNVGVSMRFPLFEGAKRRNELKRTVLEQEKIEWQKEELITNMQAGIRSTVQQLQASFKDLELSENAARAAEENFGMVQDAYVQGAVGVVELVDAQNMMIRTKTLAVNARYRYVLNYVDAERLQGDYSFLKDAEGHQEYVESLSEYLFGL
jgi:outer membrane protein TolC